MSIRVVRDHFSLENVDLYIVLRIKSLLADPLRFPAWIIDFPTQAGRFAVSKRRYESALAIYPCYHYARRNLAVLCDLYLVDMQCALDNYAAYMATVPEDDEAQMWIADIRNRMGR